MNDIQRIRWPGALVRWCVEGGRAAVFMPPRWQGLAATPMVIATLMVADLVLNILLQRLYIDGPAYFYWQAIAGGWFGSLLTVWLCYVMRSQPQSLEEARPGAAPTAAHLFAMVLAQLLVMTAVFGVVFVGLMRSGLYTINTLGVYGQWALSLAPSVWVILGQFVLLSRSGDRKPWRIVVAALTLVTASVVSYLARPYEFWYPDEPEQAADSRKRFELTQEVMEAQQPLLARHLNQIKPQRPGVIDMYVVSFAPYAGEDVFRKESELVSQVMSKRFDTAGRTLQLINHAETVETWPWATSLNLRRAIERLASVMDRDEDILFIHLTSHGARDGELAASFWPMKLTPLKPLALKAWLDEAGIKHRVISISACFSGSWIAPLAGENTLVMTASDAEHTSYGCGRKSELTYFGRAVYDEQLRSNTLSFEEAHSAARPIIKQREEEAGKSDGYSNPQIEVGADIRKRLASLQARLQSGNPP